MQAIHANHDATLSYRRARALSAAVGFDRQTSSTHSDRHIPVLLFHISALAPCGDSLDIVIYTLSGKVYKVLSPLPSPSHLQSHTHL